MPDMTAVPPPSSFAPHPRTGGSGVAAFCLGVLGAMVGVLPQVVGGGRLPLQNLWPEAVGPGEMPFSVLPVSQYQSTAIFAMLVAGGALAGLGIHVLARRSGWAAWPAALGLLVGHAGVIAQSFSVVGRGLRIGSEAADDRAALYFAGLLGGTIASALVAQAAFWTISRRSVGVAALGLGLVAAPVASWAGLWAVMLAGPAAVPPLLLFLLRWLPAVIAGAALAWCGLRPLGRVLTWLLVLAGLLLIPALLTAVRYALGLRVLDGDLTEMAAAGGQVFVQALAVGIPLVTLAVVMGIAGLVVRGVRPAAHPAPNAETVAGTAPGASRAE